MTDKPIDIGAMPFTAVSRDGKTVFFNFQGNDGVLYRFQVTQEAIPEIVENLLRGAEHAKAVRGPEPFIAGAKLRSHSMKADAVTVALTVDGERLALLFEAPGRQRVGVELTVQQYSGLAAEVAGVISRLHPPDENAN
jgi:hypothetical protein